ncbi:Asp-tRNA(Asn)/Glu-tRNA(Gln) amidotransferase subunit GatB [Candidatus Contubernalis alkaliaceticus]|uniref:Asp-tRNA(Asn)/Glu-tRNA(Gln) amidotransferase subunit GatB n=1 Tax=Candidatus Contubernalis alkaliaceticus TaxID=338645 RepID=UPI001F4C4843|nr:Asp-tRNA(Asn)/Glu-tRNA(Gln) amidotransferase subunit GatB [Candidatus Contubernalis alkalaceticus]UNC91522.1 Asp-tRNA(Asn)/Glu-tRNA(Gln) amidotransferase subunit GatB [Candidatus Contubernalis alkalaceticus]
MSKYEVVIGLEVHLELGTKTKIFCSCPTTFGDEPNTQVCPVCLGLPGVLPVLNKRALEFAVLTGLALNCEINSYSKFDRKNYFYPDLPKAYQISQFDFPVGKNGYLKIQSNGETRKIGINRVHLEEDAGKLIHSNDGLFSLVDYNRTGVPLVEIVSEPDLRSAEEARVFLEDLKKILLYTGVSDCKMEEGSLRCDANISVRLKGEAELGTKTELKNMNSFKAVQKGLEFEVERQIERLENGHRIVQETLRWDETKGETVTMRSKEEAHDYRYFPDPDLVPMEIGVMMVEKVKKELPELPLEKKERFVSQYCLSDYDAQVLTGTREMAVFFEECVKLFSEPKIVSNWVMGELSMHMNAAGLDFCTIKVTPEDLVEMLEMLKQGKISGKMAKDVLAEMFNSGKKAHQVVKEKGMEQISDQGVLEEIIQEVIKTNPGPVADYKAKKKKALGFLVGQVMKSTGGSANPQMVNEILRDKLKNV